MCHPFHIMEGPTGWLPLTFISIQSLISSVMSKWRCGSHHRDATVHLPGWFITNPSGAAPCGGSGSPWMRTWYEWHVLLAWMTIRQWHSYTGVLMRCDPDPPALEDTDCCPLSNTVKIISIISISKWFALFASETVPETVLLLWYKGPFWLMVKNAWRGSARPPWMYFSHYHPIITSRKLYLPSSPHSALQQHSCCFALFIHLETAKAWLYSDVCCWCGRYIKGSRANPLKYRP